MRRNMLRVLALLVSVVPAVLAWMAVAAADPGFVVQAVVALAVFVLAAYGLLGVAGRGDPGGGDRRWLWIGVGALVYAGVAHLVVGSAPERVLAELEPLAGVETWTLDDGGTLAFLRVTREDGTGSSRPPVVWLHDGPGIPILPMLRDPAFRPLSAAVREGFEVVFYDQRGAGFSGRLDLRHEGPYTVARHVADLEEVRGRLGAEKLILAGHGWGASLAAAYLLDHPDRVEKMILLSPGPVWYPAWEDHVAATARARLSEVQASALALLQRPPPRLVLGRLTASTSRAAAHGLVADWEADQWWSESLRESWRLGQPRPTCSDTPPARVPMPEGVGFFAHSYTLADALRLPDRRDELRALPVPVVVLRGLCDWVTSEVANEYLDLLPDAQYVAVPGAGHQIWLDAVMLQDQVVADFLAGRPLPLSFFRPGR